MGPGRCSSYKSQYYTMYSLNSAVFQTPILDILRQPTDETRQQEERDGQYRQKVLESFFRYGKLTAIPTQRKKERIVLEELVKVFEPGRAYSEREVNLLLADFHDDFCTLRRDMIAEKLMTRENGVYRRT